MPPPTALVRVLAMQTIILALFFFVAKDVLTLLCSIAFMVRVVAIPFPSVSLILLSQRFTGVGSILSDSSAGTADVFAPLTPVSIFLVIRMPMRAARKGCPLIQEFLANMSLDISYMVELRPYLVNMKLLAQFE